MAYLRERLPELLAELCPDTFDAVFFFGDEEDFLGAVVNAIGRALYYRPSLWEADPEEFADFVAGNLIEKTFYDLHEVYAWAGWLLNEFEAAQP